MRLSDFAPAQQAAIRKVLRLQFRDGFLRPNTRPDYRRHCANANAWARRILDTYSRDGKLGIIRSGMDCDCTQYYSESVMTVDGTTASFRRWHDDFLDALDGPCNLSFTTPDKITPVYRSRDRALEAYEDGHIHVVRYTPGDDLSGE